MPKSRPDRILQAVSSYLPDFLLRRMAGGKPPGPGQTIRLWGGLLQADASGFTRMSEGLSRLGTKGAEELTAVFNRFFSSMLRIVSTHGGDVLKFGGDSLLVYFPGKRGASLAARAALAMQERMKRFESISTTGGTFCLTLHVGMAAGEFRAVSLGHPDRRLDLAVVGEAVNSTVRCNEAAGPGEIAMTAECRAWLGNRARVKPQGNGFFRLEGFESRPSVVSKWAGVGRSSKDAEGLLKALVPYLPPGIYGKIEADPARSSLDSEHRRITILFLNLLYSDELLKGVCASQEKTCLALNNCYQTVQETVAAHGGVIARIDPYSVGDKLLVLFGAPVAQEDDEKRAIQCALGIRDNLNSRNAGSPYHVGHRTGINTGNAFCGEVGSIRRKEYTVMGKDVNLAARLMSNAKPGEIIAGNATFQAVSSSFRASQVKLKAKGITGPVIAYRVKGIIGPQPPGKARKARQADRWPLIGRENEIGRIDEVIQKAIQGQGQVLSIVGEPGIGKSRLTEKILDLCTNRKMKGMLVDCQYQGSNTPLLPWGEVVKNCAGILPEDDSQTGKRKLADTLRAIDSANWAPLFNDLLGLSSPENEWTRALDGKTRKERLFELVVKLTRGHVGRTPGFLIFEDVHWMDQTSLELLRLLSQKISRQPVLVALVHRPELGLGDFEGLKGFDQIRLTELTEKDALRLASAHLGSAALPDQMQKLIWEKSQGNPLYLEELIRSLRDSGHLIQGRDGKGLRLDCRPEEIEIPDTVQDVITTRIDRLEETGRKVIKTASVIGRIFSLDALASVLASSCSRSRVRYWLEYLDKLDLVPLKRSQPDEEYMFKHALTQEVAYALLSFAQKKDLHLKVGDHYQRKFKNVTEQVCELLAHHYEHSSHPDKAFVYLIQAGQKAKRTYANQEALRFFDRAQNIYEQDSTAAGRRSLPEPANYLVLKLREERGHVYRLIGEYRQAEEDFAAMLNLSKRRRNRSDQVRSLNLLAETRWLRGDYSAAQSQAQEAHAIALKQGDDAGLAMSYNVFGDLYRRQGAFEKASQAYLSSLGYCKKLEDDDGIARAYNNVGICYWSLGSLSEAAAYLQRALEARKLAQDKLGEAKTRNNLALIYQDRGQLQESLEMLGSALGIFQEMGDKRNSGYCLGNMGTIYRSQAQFSPALKAFEDSVKIFSEIGDQHALTYSIGNIGDVQLKMGNLQEAKTRYDAALSSAGELGDEELESETLSRLGEYYLSAGQMTESEEFFRRALALAERIKSQEFTMKALAGLAELSLIAERLQQAASQSDRLLAMAREENRKEYLAWGYLLRGKARSALDLFGDAEADLKEALKIAEEVGFRETTYQAHRGLAELCHRLADAEGQGRLAQAEEHRSQAEKILKEMAASISEPDLRKRFVISHQRSGMEAGQKELGKPS
jgi:predicted ATPase/class 3 adenylate cyclase